MFQVRIHGRGGQGVVSGAEILSVAAFLDGRHAQAFPSFGSERMGAPVVAFCRIDDKPIRLREPVMRPQALIIQDPTLLHHVDVFSGLAPSGYILINSTRSFHELGGGNTALDVARTAKRLGAEESIIVYRRTREKMPAHDFELQEALEEGVMVKWLSTIKDAGEAGFTVEKMELDARGFPQPTGEFETIEADSLVLALGQDVDLALLDHVPGLALESGGVKVDAQMMTSFAGIFAGGDMVPAERTITVAIGHGRKAARAIDAWLGGRTHVPPPRHELATFERLNTWYYSDAPKRVQPILGIIRRQSTFDEVLGGLDEGNALFEARRCLSCGNCLECDNCYGMCPDNAVTKLGPGEGFRFNYEYCKGCGICAAECPCGAIRMVQETI